MTLLRVFRGKRNQDGGDAMRKAPYLALGLALACFYVQGVRAQSCYQSSIVGPYPFMGNNGEIFKLADGSVWELKYEYEYLYEYFPSVLVCPGRGRLVVGSNSLNV